MRACRMATFGSSDDLVGARFVGVDLSDAVIRGSDVPRIEIDSPWLFEGDTFLRVNGVDVLPYVEAELNRRFPGRSLRHAADPAGLREAWTALQSAWTALIERTPTDLVDGSVDGEWSFVQTLRHLVFATDVWLSKAILGREEPFHPLGQPHDGTQVEGLRTGTYEEVLAARADRVAMVRDYLATVTPEELAEPRTNPWNPKHQMPVLYCLHTILDEEWEHHRYAVRDLDALSRKANSPASGDPTGEASSPAS